MFMQRLIIDHKGEFNFDYMGSSEFEFGAVRNGLDTFAQEYLKGNIIARKMQVFERWGVSTRGPVDVIVFSTKDYTGFQGSAKKITLTADKQAMRIDDKKYVAWLNVGWPGMSLTPLFVVRADFPDMKLVDELFQGAISCNKKQLESVV